MESLIVGVCFGLLFVLLFVLIAYWLRPKRQFDITVVRGLSDEPTSFPTEFAATLSELYRTGKRSAYLHHAWFWDCEQCGEENFVRAIVQDLSPDEQTDLEESPLGDAFPMVAMGHPQFVTCNRCSACFTAKPSAAIDDDEE